MLLPGIIRPPLPAHPYDVIIIGGGVNGVAIARECALGGKRVLLLEQNDFASGTSSRATRIIHGGLRYLEHGELALVRESLRERELLLRTKPDLVRPKRFILAVPEHKNLFSLRSPLALKAGLMFYRALSGGNNRTPSAKTEIDSLERSLDSGTRWTVIDYEDAQCEFPERLIADWLVEAAATGLIARNHMEVLSVEIADGRAVGVRTRDRLTGEESRFTGRWIINATGPWADRVTSASNIVTERMIGGVRGSHILLPPLARASQSAIYAEAADGRPIFIIPWNRLTLVGTTEVADDADPARVAPDAKEIDYLMRSFLRIFPRSPFAPRDIVSCYAGIRPLPYVRSGDASATTRRHFLHDHSDDGAAGLISVIGGKLTTAASLAREVAKKVGLRPIAPLLEVLSSATQPFGSMPATTGTEETLCPHTPYTVLQAVRAVKEELAVKLGDILLRRVPVALDASWSHECSLTASQRIGRALGWSDSQTQTAREDFETERNAFLVKPSTVKAS